jgi:hypothetical protein
MRPWGLCLLAGLAVGLGRAPTASAYTIATTLTPGCHERLTAQALRAVRTDPALVVVATAVASGSDDDEALVSDLPFDLDPDMRDIAAAALLVGVRDNDLKGLDAADLAALPTIHSDPNTQREHTLRRPDQDEPDGSAAALADARSYVSDVVAYALAHGLGPDGRPDPAIRTRLNLYLSLRGGVKAELPLFWIYVGQALHTLQDAYSHTFRAPVGGQITVVLNWIDLAQDQLVETRDGPPHQQQLDRCEHLDDLRRERWNRAGQASLQLLRAALTPGASALQRQPLVAAVLDEHMTLAKGCTPENRWCDAPERSYENPGACACELGARSEDTPGAAAAAVAVLTLLLARARKGRLHARGIGVSVALLVSIVVSTTRPARADATDVCLPGQQIACGCPGGLIGAQICRADGRAWDPCLSCAAAPTPPARDQPSAGDRLIPRAPPSDGPRFSVAGWLGGALDRTALAGGLGARYRLSDAWLTGAGAEWNPWISLDARRIRAGSLNLSASLIRRYEVTPRLSLRTSLHAGASVLLFSLYGAPAGSLGVYGALSWLGLEIELSPRWRLIIDPMEVAVPAPQLRAVPLVYRQYRFVVGLQFGD